MITTDRDRDTVHIRYHPPPINFSVSNFQISYLSLAPNKNRSGADTISMGNITISLIKVDSGVYVKKMSTC